MEGSNAAPGPGSPKHDYAPRRPTETILYAIVRDHLEAFLAHARESYERGLPHYVEQAFRAYLACGDFSRGFLRLHCDACRHDVLVPFSCKGRGLCPSCGARRMANEAAHLVDRVLPNVPIRQWVLSLPWELRRLAAFNAEVLTALGRIFVEEVFVELRAGAGVKDAHCGAVNFPQRFGGSLNLNVHFHALILDGVYVGDAHGALSFRPAPPPSRAAIKRVADQVHKRALRWLERHGHIDGRPAEERGNEAEDPAALDACAQMALQAGVFAALDAEGAEAEQDDDEAIGERRQKHLAAVSSGFNVHAAVRVSADKDEERERLVRYCSRPTFALERLSLLPDGRVAYEVKYPRGEKTHRIMDPLEFMARLAALIAPPRYPLVRYHGVLAPHCKRRASVVPSPRTEPAAGGERGPSKEGCARHAGAGPNGTAAVAPVAPTTRVPLAASGPPPSMPLAPRAGPKGTAPIAPTRRPLEVPSHPNASAGLPGLPALAASGPAPSMPPALGALVGPNLITVPHWNRLLGGELLATSPRVPWATLMRRTFAIDTLACPACGGRLRLLGAITERATARKILEHLGIAAEPVVVPRARGHDWPDP